MCRIWFILLALLPRKVISEYSSLEGLSPEHLQWALDLYMEDIEALLFMTKEEKEEFIAAKPRGPISRIKEIGQVPILELLGTLNRNQLRAIQSVEPMYRKAALDAFEAIRNKTENFTVMFLNNRKKQVTVYWDDGRRGVKQATLDRRDASEIINTYWHHKFFAKDKNGNIVARWEAVEWRFIYEVPSDEELTEHEIEEKAFKTKYYMESGRTWENIWPRGPPTWPFVPATEIGQVHQFGTNVSFLENCPTLLESGTVNAATGLGSKGCAGTTCPLLIAEVVCLDPPVYVLKSTLLSDYERRKIIELARPKMRQSVVGRGGEVDMDGRSSTTTWLDRKHDVVDNVIRRIADIVGIPEDVLHNGRSAESLQVVHYLPGQHYNNHIDYNTIQHKNRFVTFLIYLNDVEEGGETGFLKAASGCPESVHPGAGRGLWFYNLLPDGNVDAHTMHTGRYVLSGEKWLCNLWIWDPSR